LDLTRSVLYRGFLLNDEDIEANVVAGDGLGAGITGSVIDTATWDDTDVIQFMEKRSQADGMDVGTVELGARRIRVSGTLYGLTRALLYDAIDDLRSALSPVLAQREEPGDYGYRSLYFSRPTNRIDDYPAGAIDLMVKALPRAINIMYQRDGQGGGDEDSLAVPWQATFVCRDPAITGDVEQDYDLFGVTNAITGTAASDLFADVGHGLIAGEAIRFLTKVGGTGISLATTYYVRTTGLTADAFALSAAAPAPSEGAILNFTTDMTAGFWERANTKNRGSYLSPVNMLLVVGATAGTIACVVGDSTFTITVPAGTSGRIIRFKGADRVLTLSDGVTELPRMDLIVFSGTSTWPLIAPGTSGFTVTPATATLLTGSHMWFFEGHA